MAKPPAGFKTRLEPQDEFPHDPGEANNYNESMYFNVFDPASKMGGWFRIGNRPNEQYAEISVCLYLPDGRIAFAFARPAIEANTEMAAGGLRIEVQEPFKRLKVTYSGKALLLDHPHEMANPKAAYKNNPSVPCTVELDYEGVSPMYGGETVKVVRETEDAWSKEFMALRLELRADFKEVYRQQNEMRREIALLSKARSGASSTASDAIEPIADRAPRAERTPSAVVRHNDSMPRTIRRRQRCGKGVNDSQPGREPASDLSA